MRAAVLLVALAACTGSDADPTELLGTWSLTFNVEGECSQPRQTEQIVITWDGEFEQYAVARADDGLVISPAEGDDESGYWFDLDDTDPIGGTTTADVQLIVGDEPTANIEWRREDGWICATNGVEVADVEKLAD